MSNLPALEAIDGTIAKRIRFVAQPPRGITPLVTITGPLGRHAVAEDVSSHSPLEAAHDELCVLFIPGGSDMPIEWRSKAEEWLNEPTFDPEQSTVELSFEGERIFWRPGRAVIVGDGEHGDDPLAGLAEFSFHEGELRKLERELEADWPRAESDALTAHDVDRRALARSAAQISQMSRQTALRRIRFTRLSPRLDAPSLRLGDTSRRMVGKLAHEADIAGRIERVDKRLEVFESLYELANDRLADFTYFRLEYRLEVWIILILVIEVLVMFFELWWSWWLR
jgi:hypothetical protein